MRSGRGLIAVLVCASSVFAFGCTRAAKPETRPSAEEVWLSRLGNGPAQTARVCARRPKDRFGAALCADPTAAIRSLGDLYRLLRLDQPAEMVAATTVHSLALSARLVSALNPRVLVFQNIGDKSRKPTYDQIAIVGFARGEQLVELAALDPSTFDYSFYLLRFEQACNRTRCTPEDLLTEKVETAWTGWTLYADRDLEDTPLDCISCHRPFGPGTHKQLLMRQVFDPWMHWGHFRGGTEGSLCPNPPADGSAGRIVATADGLDRLRALEGAAGRYAAIPVTKLHAADSGDLFVNFVADAEGLIRNSPYGLANNYQYGQIGFQTREVLCERFHTGTSPTWDRHRQESRAHGLAVPYYAPDVTDPRRGAEMLADRAGFLRRQSGADAFQVAASLISADAAVAVGFTPQKEDSAGQILQAMCVRCHAAATDPHLQRARFNAEAIDRIDPATATAVRLRLSLPKSSPEVMPPARVGVLPPWAIARIEDFLRDRCSVRGGCG